MKKLFKILLITVISLGVISIGFAVANLINRPGMYAYIDSFGPVADYTPPNLVTDDLGNPSIVSDSDVRVMHLTDIHIGGGILSTGKDKKAINAVAAMITAEKPDLVIVTGDISYAVPTTGTINNKYAHSYFIRLMENLGVYWTVTFGNHDSENYNYHNRAAVAQMYSDPDLKYCLFSSDDGGVFGDCNHTISLQDTNGLIRECFIMIDSNSYTEDDPLGIGWDYDCIREDQILWYENVIESYSDMNTEIYESLPEESRPSDFDAFTTVKSMMFMHIPIREVKVAYEDFVNNNRQNTENTKYLGGNDGESDPVVYCSEREEELFETISLLGSTEALFYGHDHLNSFVLEYKGVVLSYGYSIDYLAYFGIKGKGYQRGCTMIEIDTDGTFDITHENYYQDKYPSLYEKETVNLDK